ncbi:auxin transport protein BIG [Pelomyxa schiedti]|nr:auxin transport protein BIG [Pelomyxa schiedti]
MASGSSDSSMEPELLLAIALSKAINNTAPALTSPSTTTAASSSCGAPDAASPPQSELTSSTTTTTSSSSSSSASATPTTTAATTTTSTSSSSSNGTSQSATGKTDETECDIFQKYLESLDSALRKDSFPNTEEAPSLLVTLCVLLDHESHRMEDSHTIDPTNVATVSQLLSLVSTCILRARPSLVTQVEPVGQSILRFVSSAFGIPSASITSPCDPRLYLFPVVEILCSTPTAPPRIDELRKSTSVVCGALPPPFSASAVQLCSDHLKKKTVGPISTRIDFQDTIYQFVHASSPPITSLSAETPKADYLTQWRKNNSKYFSNIGGIKNMLEVCHHSWCKFRKIPITPTAVATSTPTPNLPKPTTPEEATEPLSKRPRAQLLGLSTSIPVLSLGEFTHNLLGLLRTALETLDVFSLNYLTEIIPHILWAHERELLFSEKINFGAPFTDVITGLKQIVESHFPSHLVADWKERISITILNNISKISPGLDALLIGASAGTICIGPSGALAQSAFTSTSLLDASSAPCSCARSDFENTCVALLKQMPQLVLSLSMLGDVSKQSRGNFIGGVVLDVVFQAIITMMLLAGRQFRDKPLVPLPQLIGFMDVPLKKITTPTQPTATTAPSVPPSQSSSANTEPTEGAFDGDFGNLFDEDLTPVLSNTVTKADKGVAQEKFKQDEVKPFSIVLGLLIDFCKDRLFSTQSSCAFQDQIRNSIRANHFETLLRIYDSQSPLFPSVLHSCGKHSMGPIVSDIKIQSRFRDLAKTISTFSIPVELVQNSLFDAVLKSYQTFVPLETLILIVHIWIAKPASYTTFSGKMWKTTLKSLHGLVFSSPVQMHEVLSYETLLFLFVLYHSLSEQDQFELFKQCAHDLLDCAGFQTTSPSSNLARCRLAMLFTYLLRQRHMPTFLLPAFAKNVMSRCSVPLSPIQEAFPRTCVQSSMVPMFSDMWLQLSQEEMEIVPFGHVTFYDVPLESPSFQEMEQHTKRALAVSSALEIPYNSFFSKMCLLLNVHCSPGQSREVLIPDYCFHSYWRLMWSLPPPKQFIQSCLSVNSTDLSLSNVNLLMYTWSARLLFSTGKLKEFVNSLAGGIPFTEILTAFISILVKLASQASMANTSVRESSNAAVAATVLFNAISTPQRLQADSTAAPKPIPPPAGPLSSSSTVTPKKAESMTFAEALEKELGLSEKKISKKEVEKLKSPSPPLTTKERTKDKEDCHSTMADNTLENVPTEVREAAATVVKTHGAQLCGALSKLIEHCMNIFRTHQLLALIKAEDISAEKARIIELLLACGFESTAISSSLKALGLSSSAIDSIKMWGEWKQAPSSSTLPEDTFLRIVLNHPSPSIPTSLLVFESCFQHLLALYVHLCKALQGYDLEAFTAVLPSILKLSNEYQFSYLHSVCNDIVNNLREKPYQTLYRFDCTQRFLYELADPSATKNIVACQRSVLSAFDVLIYSVSTGVTTEKSINWTSIMKIALTTNDDDILTHLGDLMRTISQKGNFELKESIREQILAFDSVMLDKWLSQLLPSKDQPQRVSSQHSAFLENIVGKTKSKFGEHIFRHLLHQLSPPFTFSGSLHTFFSLLGKLAAIQEMKSELIDAITLILDVSKIDVSSPGILSLLEFLHRQVHGRDTAATKTTPKSKEDVDWRYNAKETTGFHKRLCTYTTTGKSYVEQPWYYCYSCPLTFSEGCCSVCARVCHKGHDVSFARISTFYCDCGAGKCKCQALVQRPEPPSSSTPPPAPPPPPAPKATASSSVIPMEGITKDDDDVAMVPITNNEQIGAALIQFLGSLIEKTRAKALPQEAVVIKSDNTKLFTNSKKVISEGTLYRPKRAIKAGAFEVKLKDSSATRELLSMMSAGNVSRSLLATTQQGLVMIAENDKLSVVSMERLLEDGPSSMDKGLLHTHTKAQLAFDIVGMAVNAINDLHVAAFGLHDCRVLVFETSHNDIKFTLNVNLEDASPTRSLAASSAAPQYWLRSVEWLPGSEVALCVATNDFVKVFDLSHSNTTPIHQFNLLEDGIAGCALVPVTRSPSRPTQSGVQCLAVVVSMSGILWIQPIDSSMDSDMILATMTITLPTEMSAKQAKTVFWAKEIQALIVSFKDGICIAGHVVENKPSSYTLEDTFFICKDSKLGYFPFTNWAEVSVQPGTFVSMSPKSEVTVVTSISDSKVQLQPLRPFSSSSKTSGVSVEGVAVLPQKPSVLLILLEDGSLCRYDLIGAEETSKAKKSAGTVEKDKNPAFPLDFFEHVENITADITLAGDILQAYTSDQAKARLAKNDEYLVSPHADHFDITIQNSDSSRVMVGIRVLVGNASLQHVPETFQLFGRSIRTKEAARRWYDIPFTIEEAMSADKEFTIQANGCYNSSNKPVVDSLEVYALSKSEFGWKEKHEGKQRAKEETTEKSPIEIAISHAITSVSACLSPSHTPAALLQQAANLLSPLLLDTSLSKLHQSIKQALRQMYPSSKQYHWVKDHAAMSQALTAATSSTFLNMDIFENTVEMLGGIFKKRSDNFNSFFGAKDSECCTSFAPALLSEFTRLASKYGSQSLETVASALANTFIGYAVHLHNTNPTLEGLAPAFKLLWELLVFPSESVRTATANAICDFLSATAAPPPATNKPVPVPSEGPPGMFFSCDLCGVLPIVGSRWHCEVCKDFDLCQKCHSKEDATFKGGHLSSHNMTCHVPTPLEKNAESKKVPSFAESMVPKGVDPTDEQTLIKMAIELSLSDATRISPLLPSTPVSPEAPIVDSEQPQSKTSQATPTEPVKSTSPPPENTQSPMTTETIGAPSATETSTAAPSSATPTTTTASSSNVETTSTSSTSTSQETPPTAVETKKISLPNLLFHSLLTYYPTLRAMGGLKALAYMQCLFWLVCHFSNNEPTGELVEKLCVALLHPELQSGVTLMSRSPPTEVDLLGLMLLMSLVQSHDKDSETDEKSELALAEFRRVSKKRHEKTGTTLTVPTVVRQNVSSRLLLSRVPDFLLAMLDKLFGQIKAQPKTPVEKDSVLLLMARSDTITYNIKQPFFPEKYVKDNARDLFGQFHNLISETLMSLALYLHRSERIVLKAPDAPPKHQYFAIEWSPLACKFVNTKRFNFMKNVSKLVLRSLCRTRIRYHECKDQYQIESLWSKVSALASGSHSFSDELTYNTNVKLVGILSKLTKVSSERPYHWQQFCIERNPIPSVILFALKLAAAAVDDSPLFFLKLLSSSVCVEQVQNTKVEAATEKPTASASPTPLSLIIETPKLEKKDLSHPPPPPEKDPKKKEKLHGLERKGKIHKERREAELAVKIDRMKVEIPVFIGKLSNDPTFLSLLSKLVNVFVLDFNNSAVRIEACSYIKGFWQMSPPDKKKVISNLLWEKMPQAPAYGRNSTQFVELLISLVSQSPEAGVGHETEMFNLLSEQNRLLNDHPNAFIYQALESVLDFDGYYLENEPCLVCNDPEVPFTPIKLSAIKAELKFTDCTQIVKLQSSHTIQSVLIRISDMKKSKMVKSINIYYNNKPVVDLSELKGKWSQWKKAKVCPVAQSQTEVKGDFAIPITAINLLIEFASFYDNTQPATEKLQCPRCSKVVTDKHGICRQCHENAYQCRQCRNINYEHLDAFLCNECGYCKFAKFEITLSAKPSFAAERIETDQDMKKGLDTIDTESQNAHKRYSQLASFRTPLARVASHM